MTAVALNLPSQRILDVEKAATQDVARAQKRVNFAVTVLGHCVDFLGSWVVARVNSTLADSLVRLKGVVALVPDLDPNRIIDPHQEIAKGLSELQTKINNLHRATLRARDDMKLRRTHEAFREGVELCAALHEAVLELKRVISDHDSKATIGDDARRLIADLKRTDDVPAGRYAELATALRGVPQRDRRSSR